VDRFSKTREETRRTTEAYMWIPWFKLWFSISVTGLDESCVTTVISSFWLMATSRLSSSSSPDAYMVASGSAPHSIPVSPRNYRVLRTSVSPTSTGYTGATGFNSCRDQHRVQPDHHLHWRGNRPDYPAQGPQRIRTHVFVFAPVH
jgi:hypothetical protein